MTLESLCFAVLFWSMGLLSCCTLVHLWFTTTLPVELAILLRACGLLRQHATVMPAGAVGPTCLEDFTRADFDSWLMLLEMRSLVNRRLAHLLRCRGCFSVHAAWMTGGAILTLLLCVWDAVPLDGAQLLVLWLLAPMTWPWLVCRLLQPATPAKP